MAKASTEQALVIVESPAKARTINRYLGKGYVVKASLGHVQDLPKKDLAVDVERDFEPTYEVIEGKKALIDELRRQARKSSAVYLAADPDREGEAICYHLAEVLQGKRNKTLKIYRVLFNEITQKSVRKAFENPMSINLDLVDAQQARRILDRLVGYKISPLLWDKVRRGLSAGRVQSVALRLVVQREQEIRAFEDEGILDHRRPPAGNNPARCLPRAWPAATKKASRSATKKPLRRSLRRSPTQASKSRPSPPRRRKRNPVAPFITSTIQQEAARKLRFSVKRTMMMAQRLYEGIELGKEGAVGLITYMRTDSTRVSDDALAECRDYIKERYGEKYLPPSANIYKTKKAAQDAHEAIRPTSVARTPDSLKGKLGEDELKVYALIWKRFVASQMNPALFDQTTIEIGAKGADEALYSFRATGSVLKFDGFRVVYLEGKDQKDEDEEDLKHKLPAVVARRHAHAQEAGTRAALHRAASALQRGDTGQRAGGAGRRSSFDLRSHSFNHPGSRIRQED